MIDVMDCVDLYCGAGGTSIGAYYSGVVRPVFALNHDAIAIKTHSANFPWVKHVNSSLENTHPSEAPKHHILLASPECTHHSRARGGQPVNDQKRCQAWDVFRWAEFHRPEWIVIENVREFVDWGPIENGKAIKSKKGIFFREWIKAIQGLGYKVEWRILNAADFGAATSRERLFVIARKGRRAPVFPTPTHGKNTKGQIPGLGVQPWRAAAEVIDWSLPCPSIFARRRPLSPKTLRRIEMGLRRFVGPFQYEMTGRGAGRSRSVNHPMPTIVAVRANHGMIVPFQVIMRNNMHSASLLGPTKTITAGGGHHGLAVPFIAQWDQTGRLGGGIRGVDDPHFTMLTKANSGLAIPFMLQRQGFYDCQRDKMPRDFIGPMPVVTASHGPGHMIVPFITPNFGEAEGQIPRTASLADGMPTITSRGAGNLIVPYVVDSAHGDHSARPGTRVYSIQEPHGTQTSKRSKAMIVPFLCQYYNNFLFSDVGSQPVPTITCEDRHCMITPEFARHVPDIQSIMEWENEGGSVQRDISPEMMSLLETMRELGVGDIGYRMFANHELALAQGFEPGYQFFGNKGQITKQIGNSVSPPNAKAICLAIAGA